MHHEQNLRPKSELLWLNLIKSKNIFRTQREFIYKTIKGAQRVGKWWLNIPNYERRAACLTCNDFENMEHILTKCNTPGQNTIWSAMNNYGTRNTKDGINLT